MSTIAFHKIWIEQCEATKDIREHFGLHDALDYLLGEKLVSFVHASERDVAFAGELPAFVQEIRRLFTHEELQEYLDHLEATKYLAPQDPALLEDDPDDHVDEPWLEHPVLGAEELLRFARIRQLLHQQPRDCA